MNTRIEFIPKPGWFARCDTCKWRSIPYASSQEARVRIKEHQAAYHSQMSAAGEWFQ